MEHAFWQERWRDNRIAFHEPAPNSRLTEHFATLGMSEGETIFVPLCGKALDLDWLLDQGLKVIGAELNEGAVREVFDRLGLSPDEARVGELTRLSAGSLTIYVGDFFQLAADELGPVDAVYDRAALVAMPESMRGEYAGQLMGVTARAKQLLVTYDYDQSQTAGPPFSVPHDKVERYYADTFAIRLLSDTLIGGPLAQRAMGREQVWLLEPK
ncbi:MAG: thiopurine S-methyltransferase [Pseudomonadota bacterium]